jgi:hypothetical protein
MVSLCYRLNRNIFSYWSDVDLNTILFLVILCYSFVQVLWQRNAPLICRFELGSLIWSVYDIDLITLFFYVLW